MSKYSTAIDDLNVAGFMEAMEEAPLNIVEDAMNHLIGNLRDHSIGSKDGYPSELDIFLEVLVNKGAPLNRMYGFETPLTGFAHLGSLISVKRLIKEGALVDPPMQKPKSSGPIRHTPLMMAASEGNMAVMEALIEAGADLETRDESQETAAFWAAQFGQMEALQYLAAQGARLDLENENASTLLHMAVFDLESSTVEDLTALPVWLIRQGLDPNRANQEGLTPLDEVKEFPSVRRAMLNAITTIEANKLADTTAPAPKDKKKGIRL